MARKKPKPAGCAIAVLILLGTCVIVFAIQWGFAVPIWNISMLLPEPWNHVVAVTSLFLLLFATIAVLAAAAKASNRRRWVIALVIGVIVTLSAVLIHSLFGADGTRLYVPSRRPYGGWTSTSIATTVTFVLGGILITASAAGLLWEGLRTRRRSRPAGIRKA